MIKNIKIYSPTGMSRGPMIDFIGESQGQVETRVASFDTDMNTTFSGNWNQVDRNGRFTMVNKVLTSTVGNRAVASYTPSSIDSQRQWVHTTSYSNSGDRALLQWGFENGILEEMGNDVYVLMILEGWGWNTSP